MKRKPGLLIVDDERNTREGLARAWRDRFDVRIAEGGAKALDELATALRRLPLPVIGRIAEDRLLLDLRCLEDSAQLLNQLPALQEALA